MKSDEWYASPEKRDGLLFRGAPEMLRLLDSLIRRPWRYGRENLLPLIYLVKPLAGASSLDGVEDRLNKACGRKIAHARLGDTTTTDPAPDPVTEIRELLDHAVTGLSGKFSGVPKVRFPHYSVATWLLQVEAHGVTADHADQVEDRIAEELKVFVERRYRYDRADARLWDIAADFPWWVRWPARWLPKLGMLMMRATWRVPRWFASHPAGERRGHSFSRLARGFAEREPDITEPDTVCRLLVDAFLEDLRRAYRRTTVLGFGRRRTTYPVLLLDDASGSTSGLRLLKLVDRSRNMPAPEDRTRHRPYRWDPLLVVSVGDATGLGALGGHHHDGDDLVAPADTVYAYRAWSSELEHAGRDRTWVLPLMVPSDPPLSGARTELLRTGLPAGRRPVGTWLLALAVLAAAGLTAFSTYQDCGTLPGEPRLEREPLTRGRDQCVGLSSGRYRFFADLSAVDNLHPTVAQELKDIEDRIDQANKRIARDPRHLTLVYMDVLTSDSPEVYRSQLEQLRGIAMAQVENESGVPLRVLLANAGHGMDYGSIAAEAVAAEAHKDPTLIAVVGMGLSREGTRQAMRRLAKEKIPMVGTVISATDLATRTTEYYHQVGPTNEREAQVVAHYAATELIPVPGKVVIYHSGDKDDLYSNDLKDQVRRMFEAEKIKVEAHQYRVNPNDEGLEVGFLGGEACQVRLDDGVVFYAGRAEQLDDFLKSMKGKCEGNYPRIFAGDTVTRFVLNKGLQEFPGLVLDHISLASSVAWEKDCVEASANVDFYKEYSEMFDDACVSLRNGRAVMAYDALRVVTQAVRSARKNQDLTPSPDRVLGEIKNLSVMGASGYIDYALTDDGVPRNKAILLLEAKGGSDDPPTRLVLCGELTGAPQSSAPPCP